MSDSAHEIYSVRADSYREGRPTYPHQLLEVLTRRGVDPGSIVVDLGAGTGAMSRLLMTGKFRVIGVEPNQAMRQQAETSGASMVAALAEALPFAKDSVDAVVVGQALHWFDPELSAASIWNILRPDRGILVAVWNERCMLSLFEQDVEAALRRAAPTYRPAETQETAKTIFERFTTGRTYSADVYPNHQDLGEEQLMSRFLSTSWAPEPGTTQARTLIKELAITFHRHQRAGLVRLSYQTLVMSTRQG
jgi:SAM-dependent methyltransferase